MISSHKLAKAADAAMTDLLQWGIGGVVLAVFVAPTFFWLARGALRRQEERDQRDDKERAAAAARQDKLIDALAASVEQQKDALAILKRKLEADEAATNKQIMEQSRIVEMLDQVAKRLAQGGPPQ